MSKHAKKVRFSDEAFLQSQWISIPFRPNFLLRLSITATSREQDTLTHIIRQIHNTTSHLSTLQPAIIRKYLTHIKQLLTLDCMTEHQNALKTHARDVFFQLIHQQTHTPIHARYWRHIDHKKERAYLDMKIAIMNAELFKLGAILFDSVQEQNSPLISPHEAYKKNLKHRLDRILAARPSSVHHYFAGFREHLSNAKNLPYVQFDRLIEYLDKYLLEHLKINPSPQANTLQHYLKQCQIRITQPLPEHLQSQLDKLLVCYDNEHNVSLSRRISRKFEFLTALSDTIKDNPEKNYTECYRLVKASSRASIQELVSEGSCTLTLFAKHRFKDFITALLDADSDYEQLNRLTNTTLNNHSHDDAGRFSC
ncbi:MAG: hypothetical protein P1U39_05885 [Legionellaceae bacterium]|nr:hypothetical protein [Legionellaceae bacterium]